MCLLKGTPGCKGINMSQFIDKSKMRLFLLLLLAVLLVSCATEHSIRADFEKNMKSYNESVRWHQLEDATHFASQSVLGAYRDGLKAARHVVVVDYRVINIQYDEITKKAEAVVEIDYYTSSSARMRTATDNQKWAYEGKGAEGVWRLISPFPAFP